MKIAALLLLMCSFPLHGMVQGDTDSALTANRVCNKLIPILKRDFTGQRVAQTPFPHNPNIKKAHGRIQFPFNGKMKTLKDDPMWFTYSVAGEDTSRKWLLIMEDDMAHEQYYLYNLGENRVDTLTGKPILFADYLVCWEDPSCDERGYFEIWDIRAGTLRLLQKITFDYCEIYRIDEAYLRDGYLYLAYADGNGKTKYAKYWFL